MSKEIRHEFFMSLTWWLLTEDVWRRVEGWVVVAQLWRVEAKEAVIVALSDASLLGLDKHNASTVNAGAAVVMECLIAFASSPGRSR